MENKLSAGNIAGWTYALILFGIGIANLILVHPVPGIAYMLASLIFVPPVTEFIRRRSGFTISPYLKVILGVMIMWFTLGVSDLAEICGL